MKNIYISLDDRSMVSNMRKDNDTVSVGEVVDYICKLQAVANAAENMISQSRSAKLDKALAALKPKTTEQLLAERLKAADNLRSKAERQRILNDEESFSRMSTARQVKTLVERIVGPIEPAGETHLDGKRYENLVIMCSLVDALVAEIDAVGMHKVSHQASVKKAGEFASEFMTKTLGIVE